MDEKLINELIAQLEQNLQKVESARQQVEKTVQAYDALKVEVSKYTTELSFIAQNVRTMISQLEEIKEKFLGNISVEIVKEIKAAVANITGQIGEVSSQLDSLKNLIESQFDQLGNDLKQRADFIDSTLSTIRVEIKAVDEKVASCLDKLEQLSYSLQQLKDNENNHFNAIVKRLEEQEARINTIIKQNKMFSFVIIFLILVSICLICFILFA